MLENSLLPTDHNDRELLGLTSCAMIARGALIKPWLPKEIKDQNNYDIPATERLAIIEKFCKYGLEHWGSDQQGIDTTRRFLLEWLSFLHRYVPLDLTEKVQRMNQRPPAYFGRDDLETLLASPVSTDWIKISEMFLGNVKENFIFIPKHKTNSYAPETEAFVRGQALSAINKDSTSNEVKMDEHGAILPPVNEGDHDYDENDVVEG
jgi:hypothetical protein